MLFTSDEDEVNVLGQRREAITGLSFCALEKLLDFSKDRPDPGVD